MAIGEQSRSAGDAATHRRSPLRASVVLAALALFAYALWFRVDGIAADFWMMNDQIEDWDLVQGSFIALPLSGPLKSGGGTHLGPAYYWWLWLARRTLSPWLGGGLPHAAGIATSFLDALSFSVLLIAIAALGIPLAAAAAAVLLAATVPYEGALARAGWNPTFALACIDLALALFLLWRGRPSAPRAALIAAVAWAGVQSHLSAVVVALPLFFGLVVGAARRGARRALHTALAIALVIGALQVPRLLVAGGDDETAITRTLAGLVAHPSSLLAARGWHFVLTEGPTLLARGTPVPPWAAEGAFVAAIAWAAVASARGRVAALPVLVALATLATASAAYGILLLELMPYFLIPLLGLFAMVLALAFSFGARPRWRGVLGGVALALVLAAQPRRCADRRFDHSYALYAPLVRGAREIVRRGVAVRRVDGPADGRLPTSTTPLVRWLGGRIDPDARAVATISPDGAVRFSESP
jgi:hypothetical protein